MFTDSIVSFKVITNQEGDPLNVFLNIYWYIVQETTQPSPITFSPLDWAACGAAFEDQIIDPHKAIASNQLQFNSVHMIEESNVLKPFGDWGLSASNGTVSQGIMPDFTAYGFRLVRVDNSTRNGYKRLPGVPVGAFLNGVLQAPFTTSVPAMETAIEGTFGFTTDGGNWTMRPVIVRRNNLGMPVAWQTPSFVTHYGATTQNTRKR